MNTLLLVAIVGVAAAALGMGALGNQIVLDVQQLGVGETNLVSPISEADVAFEIARQSGGQPLETHNVISACYIHTGDSAGLDKGDRVFCKLTDLAGNVAAEGVTVLSADVPSSQTFTVLIDTADFPANKVQNIHDVIIVVQEG